MLSMMFALVILPLILLSAVPAFKTGWKMEGLLLILPLVSFKLSGLFLFFLGLEDGLICNVCVGTHPGCGLYDFDYR